MPDIDALIAELRSRATQGERFDLSSNRGARQDDYLRLPRADRQLVDAVCEGRREAALIYHGGVLYCFLQDQNEGGYRVSSRALERVQPPVGKVPDDGSAHRNAVAPEAVVSEGRLPWRPILGSVLAGTTVLACVGLLLVLLMRRGATDQPTADRAKLTADLESLRRRTEALERKGQDGEADAPASRLAKLEARLEQALAEPGAREMPARLGDVDRRLGTIEDRLGRLTAETGQGVQAAARLAARVEPLEADYRLRTDPAGPAQSGLEDVRRTLKAQSLSAAGVADRVKRLEDVLDVRVEGGRPFSLELAAAIQRARTLQDAFDAHRKEAAVVNGRLNGLSLALRAEFRPGQPVRLVLVEEMVRRLSALESSRQDLQGRLGVLEKLLGLARSGDSARLEALDRLDRDIAALRERSREAPKDRPANEKRTSRVAPE